MRFLNTLARHVVVVLAALALAVLLSRLLGIDSSRDPRFFDMSIALVVLFLIALHWRWLLGINKRSVNW